MPNLLASYMQGQQAVENNKRNKLLDLELQDAPARQERQNRLADLQVQRQQQVVDATNQEQQQAQEAEGLKRAIAEAGFVIESPNPKAFAEQKFPGFIQQMRQQGTWDDWDDDDVRAFAGDLRKQLSAKLGIGPEKKFERVEGPRGSVLQKDASTGQITQVVGPDNTEAARRSSFRSATADEISARGLPSGTSAQVDDATGRFDVINKPDQNLQFARADKLRDEYNSQSKEFTMIGDAYQRLESAATEPSAAGDLALIFSFMKILDPTSVVREQEFANAQNAAGIPDRVRAAYNRALNGERLPPSQRNDFLTQARNLYKGQEKRQLSVRNRYSSLAKKAGVDVDYVVGDLPEQQASATQQPVSQPQVQQNGPVRVSSAAEASKLPPGTVFVTPDGRTLRVPQR